MKGWIIYKRCREELLETDHGVNRFLAAAALLQIELEVFKSTQFQLIASSKKDQSILLNGQPVSLPDFILPRVGADATNFDLALIRQLELMGVYSANSLLAIETVKDKMRFSQLMTAHDLPSPKTMMLSFPVSVELVKRETGFPAVIKPITGARGAGVYLCESSDNFVDLMSLLGTGYSGNLIAQQFIDSSYARDLRVFVVGDQVIACMQRTSRNSFKANYSLGSEVSLFPVTKDIEQLALACTKLVGLEIAGIDLLFAPEGFIICEANSSPGFKGMELVTGEDIANRILKYIHAKCSGQPCS